VFNFALDILYFEWPMQNRIAHFLGCLTDYEANHIQSIAVDHLIDEDLGYDYSSEDKCLGLFKSAISLMPAMKEFLIVYNIGDDWHEHGLPEGPGSIEIYDEFQYEWQQFIDFEGIHFDDEYGEYLCQSDCQELPSSEHLTNGFNVPKVGSVWGWRPMMLY
jgi:hypothetical protein